MPLLLRQDKATALTNTELDENFIFLNGRINTNTADITEIVDVTVPSLETNLTDLIGTKQNLNPKLTSLSGNAVTGFLSLVNVSSGDIVSREILQGSVNIVIANGDGIAGNPTIDIGSNVLTNTSTHVISNKTISGNNNTIESIPAASITGVLAVNRGGTGAATIPAARTALGVMRAPATNGIAIQTSTDSSTTREIKVQGSGISIINGTGVAGDPTIISSATASNSVSTIVSRDASGNFAAGTITATLNGNALTASSVTDGVYTTGSYSNPSWITSLAGSKVTNIPNSSLQNSSLSINGVNISLGQSVTMSAAALGGVSTNTPNTLVSRDASGNFAAGTITATLNGNASSSTVVTNGVYTTGSYSNPTWITSLAGSKVTNIPNSSLQNPFVVLNGIPMPLGQSVTFPFVSTTGSYSNPSWITSLAGSKVTNIPVASLQTSSLTINGVSIGLGESVTLTGNQLGGVSSSTPSTLVLRDASGDFAAGTITATLNGNASSATSAFTAAQAAKLVTARTINGVAFDGTQNIAIADQTKLPLSGGAMGGFITLNAEPTANLHAATKQYVDTKFASVPSGIKAWVTFNGVNGNILGAFNVTSISIIGEGKYQINIAAGTFTNGNFAAAGMASDVDHLVTFNNSSQTSLQVYTSDAHADSNNQTSRTTGRVMVMMVGT